MKSQWFLVRHSPTLVMIYFLITAGMKAMYLGDFAAVTARMGFIAREYRPYVALGVPLLEVVAILLLVFYRTQIVGVVLSFIMLVAFSIYLAFHLDSHCGCTGKEMTNWSEVVVNSVRIVFNLSVATALAIWFVNRVRTYSFFRIFRRKEKVHAVQPSTS